MTEETSTKQTGTMSMKRQKLEDEDNEEDGEEVEETEETLKGDVEMAEV
jgi:hypothetical protein